MKKAVVIPCYKVLDTLLYVVSKIPQDLIDYIIVIDDKCPDSSGKLIDALKKNNIVIFHAENQGVGGAVMTGYTKALELECDIIIKVDGDGQMDPADIKDLIEPLVNNQADYTKGNRFNNASVLKLMPKVRLFGNSFLSFIIKFVSGYWNVFDPTNGYTAIHRRVLEKIDLTRISKGYFFEIHMLIELNIINAVVKDVALSARYGNETSSLKISTVLIQFPAKIIKGFLKRVLLKYFIYDFNMASVYIVLGVPLFIFSCTFGIWQWVDSFFSGQAKSAGTIMLAALPLVLSFQMLLQAIHIDIANTPRKA